MIVDPNNPVIRLCVEGTRAEFEHRIGDARNLYWQAWQTAQDDYEACIAAHYVARHREDPAETLRWNEEALLRANAVGDSRVQDFYPSLYLSLGHAHEISGNQDKAQFYYSCAIDLGVIR